MYGALMPERARSHQIETESRVAFETALGSRFTYQVESAPEYGIDGRVEEFDASNRATGLRVWTQLKGTDEEDLSKSLAVSLRWDTVAYLRSQALPVLMVRYRTADKTLYTRWFHQFEPPKGKLGEKTVTFRWKPTDLMDEESPERLVEEARAFLELRSSTLGLPLDLYLEVGPEGALGLASSVLLFALRDVTDATDVFAMKSGPPPPASIRVAATDERLSVNLAEVTSTLIDLDNYQPGEVGEEFGRDAMVLAALALDRIGRTDAASRLTVTFLEHSALVRDLDIAWSLSMTLRRSRRIREALQIADSLDASDDPARQEASFLFLLAARWHVQSWSDEELAEYRELMEARISRRQQSDRPIEAARESYSLATVFRGCRKPEDALASYDQAATLEPAYVDRPYFHEERAGALFGCGRYDEAAQVYGLAQKMQPEPRLVGLRADSLMFAGSYADALAAFREFNASGEDKAEWRIKEVFMAIVVEQLEIDSQARDHDAAMNAVDLDYEGTPPSELAIALERVPHLDALFAVAYFNLGRAHLDLGLEEAALANYLAAAACQRVDAEAWMNVMIQGMNVQRYDLAADAVVCGATIVGQSFRRELVRWTHATKRGVFGDQMLAIVDKVFDKMREEERQREERGHVLVRLLNDDGPIEEVVLRAEET
jgi:tetratricopeptide (TPR) repeat protein